VAPSMIAQGVANTLWGFLTLAGTRGVPLPACYPSLWRADCALDVGYLNALDLCNLFHAYRIHTELVPGGDVQDEVTFPAWITHEAREAWMRDVRDNVRVSRAHKEIASIIGDLGVPRELERLTDDDLFSVDIYLPDDDVAIEFDGPTHFITISDGGGEGAAPGDASRRTRSPKTELRDKFLERRHRTVTSVPWFEWAVLRGSAEKKAYVTKMLRAAGVSVPAST
jgi:hypothetical protein